MAPSKERKIMLRSLNELEGYAIGAADGPIGHVTDFLFDDETWVVRYLVVDTGSWLSSRKVLISPIAIGQPTWTHRTLPVSITREQVRNSPDIDTDKPVSRQYELGYADYYGYFPYYWGASGLWGASDYPGTLMLGLARAPPDIEPRTVAADRAQLAREIDQHRSDDPHLRSVKAVMHYHIEASDGGIGHVQGLLLDEQTWAIRYLIVDTSNWWLGHQVLIAPRWIDGMSWSERTVSINLSREAIKGAPPYHAAGALDRTQELRLHEHYRRPGYWAEEVKLENPEFRAVKTAPDGAIHKYT
jgi:hypothetical protein